MQQEGFTIWITGLPGAGKSSLAGAVAAALSGRGFAVEVIDSGKLRASLLGNALGFSRHERHTNNLQHAFAAKMLSRNGVIPVVAAVSPYRATRRAIREALGTFVEVHAATEKAVCIDRDTKGLWARALAGEVQSFTGVDDPYEAPQEPEVRLDLGTLSPQEGAAEVLRALETLGYLARRPDAEDPPDIDAIASQL
ncbi:MAG: adenylyl-sulfate kinase [Alphaproteobacteria bacterium]|nr:adenylyl-sulfate kinase [Alphaproteobacteria bacterium]